MKKQVARQVASMLLALSLMSMPVAAFADGIVQLSPMSANGTTSSPSMMTTSSEETIPLRGRISTIPKGATMMVKLDQPISSFSSNLGDAVSATLENDVFANDVVVVPAGSEVLGQVSNVKRAGRLGKHGEIDIRFFSVKTPDGVVVPIRAHVVTKDNSGILRGNSYAMDVFKGVGITAGATGIGAALGVASGSLMGSVAGGVLFGTAAGGIAGATYALMRQGKDVVIPSGSRVSIVSDVAAQ
jgi:hypothetical protein